MNIDVASITDTSLYGQKGVGALYVRPQESARAVVRCYGGGHERGCAPGTLLFPELPIGRVRHRAGEMPQEY